MRSPEQVPPPEGEERVPDGETHPEEDDKSAEESLREVLREVEEAKRLREQNKMLLGLAVEAFRPLGFKPVGSKQRYPTVILERELPATSEGEKERVLSACRDFALEVQRHRCAEVSFLASDALCSLTVNFGVEDSVSMYSDEIQAIIVLFPELTKGDINFVAHSHPSSSDNTREYLSELFSLRDLVAFVNARGLSESHVFTPRGTLTLRKTKGGEEVLRAFNTVAKTVTRQERERSKELADLLLFSQGTDFDKLPEPRRRFFEELGIRWDRVVDEEGQG